MPSGTGLGHHNRELGPHSGVQEPAEGFRLRPGPLGGHCGTGLGTRVGAGGSGGGHLRLLGRVCGWSLMQGPCGCSANVCCPESFTELSKEKSTAEHSSAEGMLRWPWAAGENSAHRGTSDALASPLPETCHPICSLFLPFCKVSCPEQERALRIPLPDKNRAWPRAGAGTRVDVT